MIDNSKRILILLFGLVLMVALTLPGYSATLVVDGNASDCDDDSDPSTPYCTIQAAVNDANSGDTLEIHGGLVSIDPDTPYVYEENVKIEEVLSLLGIPEGSGSREKSYPNVNGGWLDDEDNYTDSGDTIWLEGAANNPISDASVKYLILRNGGVGVPGSPEIGGALWLTHVNDSLIVVDAGNSEVGVGLDNSNGNVIDTSYIRDNEFAGIGLWNSGGNTIRYSHIFSNTTGLRLFWSDNNTIDNNLVGENQVGIEVEESEGNTLADNIIGDNRRGIVLSGADNNVLKNNYVGIEPLIRTFPESREEPAYLGNGTGILLYNSDNNTIGPGNQVKYNGIGMEVILSNNTLITNSKFTLNGYVGTYLPQEPMLREDVKTKEVPGETYPITSINNLRIENSEFNRNDPFPVPDGYIATDSFSTSDISMGISYGFLSETDIENMKVTNSEFNSNAGVGMAFTYPRYYTNDGYLEPGVSNLSIADSHFNGNAVSLDERIIELAPEEVQAEQTEPLSDYGYGFLSDFNMTDVMIESSTFNENFLGGIAFGDPYRILEGDTGALSTITDMTISESSINNNDVFGLLSIVDIQGLNVSRSEFSGNVYGIYLRRTNPSEPTDVGIHHSVISGNNAPLPSGMSTEGPENAGLINAPSESGGTSYEINAAINWWGSPDGPNYSEDGSLDLDYSGGGDLIVGPVAFAPWITKDPDADPDKPGVQLISPFPIYVHTVGPTPTTENGNTGYLDMAIWGAGAVPQVGQVIVPHGTWEAREPIGNYAELISVKGTTCHTCLKDVEDSKITINDDNVTIGKLDDYVPRGFIVKDEVVVKSGVDSSTVHLNWNDVRNTVTNNGKNELDASYNWWGDLDPSDDVTGEVDYRPFLPEDPCSFTDYMEDHDIEDPRAAIAGRMIGSSTCSKKLPSRMIVNYHLKPEEAEEIVDKYGCYDVRLAMEESPESYEGFMSNLGA